MRDFDAFTISYQAPLYDVAIAAPDGQRRRFSGSPTEIAADNSRMRLYSVRTSS